MKTIRLHYRKADSCHSPSRNPSVVRVRLLLTAIALLMPAMLLANPITAIYVFGDSLSDGGNAYLRTGGLFPPAPYAQRFSNGPIAVERLAANLGVPLNPSFTGGTNYAVGGAATGQVPIPGEPTTTDNYITVGYPPLSPFFANTGIEVQVGDFTSSPPAFDPLTSLFVVWGGPNDFFINPSAATAAAAVSNLFGELNQLYGVGGRNFLVPNMPDLSKTPSGRSLSPAEQLGLNQLSIGFNAGLKSTLDLVSLFPDINIIQFDTFGLFNEIAANPAAFGLTNVTNACLADAGCNPSTYLFWDSVHPTTAGAEILGDRFTDAVLEPVPEPTSLLLFGVGLGAIDIGMTRRNTKRG